MRLSRIKLAGFKSFVDPTMLVLPGNRVGIVGPNGCGKSNTIDAVRWVMGESSVKHLRGDSSEDVIFSGSASRKPVGQASIELFFDNSEGRLGGEYGGFAEISIRRALTRDGQSKYFLNGQRARRRDVTDLFLGTGLGPRSYAIIEQGMISRLIEARPEDLRVYLEEAAGISKYKERRRETETRIRHTRENLERLDDVREEVERQATKLTRQAQTAERYQNLAAQRRLRRAELLVLRLAALDGRIQAEQRDLGAAETALVEVQARVQRSETESEVLGAKRHELERNLQQTQAAFYEVSADVSRLEQSIRHAESELERERREQSQIEARIRESERAFGEAERRVDAAVERIAEHELEADAAGEVLERAEQEAEAADEALHAARDARSAWHREVSEPQQAAQLFRARMDHADEMLQRARQRRERLREELERLPAVDGGVEADAAEAELELATRAQTELQQRHSDLRESLATLRVVLREERESGHALERRAQEIAGRLASLKILPGVDEDQHREPFEVWARGLGIDAGQRVAEQIEVESGWEMATETVLGHWFEAVSLQIANLPADLPDAGFRGLDPDFEPGEFAADSLALRVQGPAALRSLLAGIHCASSLSEARERLSRCGDGESVVTSDGTWLGKGWICHRTVDRQVQGVIERTRLERSLEMEAGDLDARIEMHVQRLEQRQGEIEDRETELEQIEAALRESQREMGRLEGQVQRLRERARQVDERRRRLAQESGELEQEIEQAHGEREAAAEERNRALARLEDLNRDQNELDRRSRSAEEAQQAARRAVQLARERAASARMALQEARHGVVLEKGHAERLQQQTAQDRERMAVLERSRTERLSPLDGWRRELQAKLSGRQESEMTLTGARAALDGCDAALRELAAGLRELHGAVEQSRSGCEERRLHLRELGVQQEQWVAQLRETGFTSEDLAVNLGEEATIPAWEEAIDDLDRRIERLGPINLAAIDEARELIERSRYLQEQHNDLVMALETLEQAMQKIDRETRSLFRDTFDRVNSGLDQKFRRLFGGGEARLDLTGEDLLDTGVAIMARPPGKRLSTIHLMSGGEKALTAVALVFAIFELNPAPFCMLDEVDAPLDEANVGRFCALLQEMSERIQFIFITHNKTTMAMAEQLIGVTMQEPGVSRLVSVDIDAAVELAGA